jgi:hypothetical protein
MWMWTCKDVKLQTGAGGEFLCCELVPQMSDWAGKKQGMWTLAREYAGRRKWIELTHHLGESGAGCALGIV